MVYSFMNPIIFLDLQKKTIYSKYYQMCFQIDYFYYFIKITNYQIFAINQVIIKTIFIKFIKIITNQAIKSIIFITIFQRFN